jgi:hypothetical protein
MFFEDLNAGPIGDLVFVQHEWEGGGSTALPKDFEWNLLARSGWDFCAGKRRISIWVRSDHPMVELQQQAQELNMGY